MNSLFSLSSCDINNDVQKAISNGQIVLPIDTSIFVYNHPQENVAALHSQIDIAKKMGVVAAPSMLLNGKVKIGLSNTDFLDLKKLSSPLQECTLRNIDKCIQNKESGYFASNMITYIGNLLNVPLTVSGFIRGLDKFTTATPADIESIRQYHTTNINCGFDVTTDVYSSLPYLASNQINIITPSCQYIPIVYNRLIKQRSDITTYSYSELATLLVNNEQLHYPSSYFISIHTKDTTRTALIEKLYPAVTYELNRNAVPNEDKGCFIHNKLNEMSNGLAKKFHISCLRETTKAGIALLQKIKEQRGIIQLKTMLEKENESEEMKYKSLNEEEFNDDETFETDNVDTIETKSTLSTLTSSIQSNKKQYITLFNKLDNSYSTENQPVLEEDNNDNDNDDDNDDEDVIESQVMSALPQSSYDSLSSDYFLKSTVIQSNKLQLSPYSLGSPVCIGEIAMGQYHQPSTLQSRSNLILHDVGGVARNTYETLLRQIPEKRPILIGTIGKDENGRKIKKYHSEIGDTLHYIREEKGKTRTIWGFYDDSGKKEWEVRNDDAVLGVNGEDIIKNNEVIQKASLVFIDSSIEVSAMEEIKKIFMNSQNQLLLDPSDAIHYSNLLDSGLLRYTDYILPSIDELWSLACIMKPSLKINKEEWNELNNTNENILFSDAILHLKEPIKVIMNEMKSSIKDKYMLLKMPKMGIAMIGCDKNADDMDVVHFNIEKSYKPTFESNIAFDEAFTGGFMYGLTMEYPMNLSIALGINTLRVNSHSKQIISPSINSSIHHHYIKSYMRLLWGYICLFLIKRKQKRKQKLKRITS